MFRFVLYISEYLIVTLVRFVLLLLLFNFVMHCIISTVVVAFEINYLSIYLYNYIIFNVTQFNAHPQCLANTLKLSFKFTSFVGCFVMCVLFAPSGEC